ncbi:MAG: flagellar biosynthesis protein FlhB [Lachnospiraceae bacterium]|nr:flagellar biosynthesis protein FlhB [Dorea sp.]MDE7037669.1 flagellar biosynthesis protein FlhB [Lachnospiraceae bacterium]
MASDEKTEKATPKKRRDQRKKGNVATSKDVIAVASLVGCFYCLQMLFPTIYKSLREMMIFQISSVATIDELSLGNLQILGMKSVNTLAKCIFPLGVISLSIGVIATGIQTRFLFTKEPLKFKLSKLNPLNGIKNMFSAKQLVELVKSVLKIIVLAVVLYNILKDEIIVIAQMLDVNPINASAYVLKEIMSMVLQIGMIFAAIAGFDYFYQRWKYEKDLKMSKEEVKEEFKQMEGDPKVKGKIRSLQQSMARSRMMQAVPDADVIIRNPTHYAVALKYDIDHDNAPKVIAKGQDLVALKIVEIGQQNKVTVIENKPLARGLYASTPLGGQIPAEYYGVVAEILVEIFRMNKKLV